MTPRKVIVPVFVPHLGCPHDCVFCNQRKISGAQTPATADTVRRAVESAENLKNTTAELAFYGGSFTAIPAHEQESLLEAAQPFLKMPGAHSIRLSTRPDAIDGRVIERLKKYGVGTVELGVQSMDEDVLLSSGRGHSAEDAERAAKLLKDAGFTLILQMMTGLPGDTLQKSVKTAERLIGLKPDGVRIYPTVIVRDTALFDMWLDGRYAEHTVEEAVRWCAVLVPMFRNAGIPVIRLGLNPTEELSGGDAAGGAYHPALGELVYSRIYLNTARELLRDIPKGKSVELGVKKGRVSLMTGQHRGNVKALTEEFGLSVLKVRETDTEKEVEILKIE